MKIEDDLTTAMAIVVTIMFFGFLLIMNITKDNTKIVCVSGHQFVLSSNGAFQILDSNNDPIPCKCEE